MTAAPLSRTTAVFPLVDHQTSVLERVVKARPRDLVEANLVRPARAATVFDMPLIFTTRSPHRTARREHACPPQ
jgi:hypothetical protein